MSLVERNQLYSFANHFFYLQISMIILGGIVSINWNSFMCLEKYLDQSVVFLKKWIIQDSIKENTRIHATGIQEIDQFSSAIIDLSQEVLETSTKFLNIMNMASIDIGGL